MRPGVGRKTWWMLAMIALWGGSTAATAAGTGPESLELTVFGEYLSLDQLLQQRMGVSTLKEMTAREAPNILTVITADEIANTGARDLMDVLKLVPSFEFGCDVSGVVDIGERGLWAHEGKVLFLLDGLPLNEIAYGTMALGNHIPVDAIDRIEIIRGPGSALYGGYAELGVVNIKTKTGQELDGASLTGIYSRMSKTFSHRDLVFSFGKQVEGLDASAHVFWGQGNRSDRLFTSFYTGETYDMTTNSQLNPTLVDLGLKYKGLELRTLLDEYHTTERDWWGADLPRPVRADFNTRMLDVKYEWKNGALTLTPRLTVKEQEPYQRNGVNTANITPETYTDPGNYPFEVWVRRQTASLIASYDFSEKNNVLAGLEDYQEQGESISDAEPSLLPYNNFAAFFQGIMDVGGWVNLTAGGRYERHSQYGHSAVPRLGLTKVLGDWHFKLLYSKAFRVPQLETIVLNPDIVPEYSRTTEVEAGYRVSDKLFATLNLFDILIDNPIVYWATTSQEYQMNSGPVGTRGAEFSCKYRDTWGFVNLGYAYNRTTRCDGFVNPETGLPVDGINKVPGQDDRMLGLPGQKWVLNANLRLLDQLSVNPEAIWHSQRFGYTSADSSGNPILKEFAPVLQLNLFVAYALWKELHLGAGVNNLTDAPIEYIQAYNGGHAPIPGPSRAVIGKIWYTQAF